MVRQEVGKVGRASDACVFGFFYEVYVIHRSVLYFPVFVSSTDYMLQNVRFGLIGQL